VAALSFHENAKQHLQLLGDDALIDCPPLRCAAFGKPYYYI
jgi:hypothetical protein